MIKDVPAQSALSVKALFRSFDDVVVMQQRIRAALPERGGYGLCFVICYDDEVLENDMTLELGCMIETPACAPLTVHNDWRLTPRQLPAAPIMATTIITGGQEAIHAGYGAMGMWVQNHGYRLAGRPRELTLQATEYPDGRDLVTEIQFPVEWSS